MTYRTSPRRRKEISQEKMRYCAVIQLIKKRKKKKNKLHAWGDKIILKFKGRKIK